jgi:hypothetical protein
VPAYPRARPRLHPRQLYVFNGKQVPLFGAGHTDGPLAETHLFFALYNGGTLFGDTISRRLAYRRQPSAPLRVGRYELQWSSLAWLPLSFAGGALCLSKVGLAAPLGMFAIFFANGSIYATTTRFIDESVPKRFNLISLSVWLFVGDIGSVVGSLTLASVQAWACRGVADNPYVCVPALPCGGGAAGNATNTSLLMVP